MSLPALHIIESEEESSLHPRAIWNHWKKNIIWDPRSYYGALEFIGLLVLYFLYMNIIQNNQYNVSYTLAKFASGLFLLIPVAVLHWYSNHRHSNSILTRSKVHLYVLLFIVFKIFLFQLIGRGVYLECYYDCQFMVSVDLLLWIAILILLWTCYVIYAVAKNTRKGSDSSSVLPEGPSPSVIDSYPEDESQRAWGDSTIAEGIEDDSAPLEGQLRL